MGDLPQAQRHGLAEQSSLIETTRWEDVVDFYDGGGNANPYQDPRIKPLGLDEDEKAALAAFLRSLTGVVREGS